MKISKQRIVYYLDIKKQILCGYTEIHIKRDQKEDKFVFRSCCLKIEEITVVGHQIHKLKHKYVLKNKGVESMEGSDGFVVSIPSAIKMSSIILRIQFAKTEESGGVVFYRPTGKKDLHREMTVENLAYACPFIDQITNIEIIYILPNTRDVEIASSGKFVSFSEKSNSLIYVYEAKATSPQNILFAVGMFQSKQLSDESNVYFPSHFSKALDEFSYDVHNITKYMNSYAEMETPSVIFTLNDTRIRSGKNIVMLNVSLLGRARDVEINFRLKEILCETFSDQIFMHLGHNIIDSWIFRGLSGYLADTTLRFLLGHNEFVYRCLENQKYLIENDILEPPLFYPEREEVEYRKKFFKVKSKMVFHTMHNQLSSAFMKKIIVAVIKLRKNLIASQLSSGRTAEGSKKEASSKNTISGDESCFTPLFIRIVKDSSGKEMKKFFDFYIFNAGLIKVDFFVKLDTKKGTVIVTCKETLTTKIKTSNTTCYAPIKIKSIESDGTFTQKIFTDRTNSYQIHKKSDSGTLLFLRADCRREGLNKIEVHQSDQMFVEQLLDKSAMGQLEAVDALKNNASAEAIEALERIAENQQTFFRVKLAIFECIKDIRINFDAKQTNTLSYDYNGLMRLIQLFIKLRCVPSSTIVRTSELGISNFLIQKALVKNITDISYEKFLRNGDEEWENSKAVLDALGRLTKEGLTKDIRVICAFLNNLISYTDTIKENFDDPYYLSNILNKLSIHRMFLSDLCNNPVESCVADLERFRILDMVFPSPRNLISVSALISLIRLGYRKQIKIKQQFLRNLVKYPNFPQLRLVAAEGLLLFYSSSITLFDLVQKEDSSLMVSGILRLLVKMIETGFKSAKTFVKRNGDNLMALQKLFVLHPETSELFELILQREIVNETEFIHHRVFGINYSLENKKDFTLVVEKCLGNKRIVIADLFQLRTAVFKLTYKLKLPYKKKVQKIPKKTTLVRLKCSVCRPQAIAGHFLIRFRAVEIKVKYRNCDIPALIFTAMKHSKSFTSIEKYLRSIKEAIFDSFPFPLKKVYENFPKEELVKTERKKLNNLCDITPHANRMCLCNYLEQTFKSIRYVFAHAPINSKLYFGCKSIANSIERVLFQYNLIPAMVVPMDDLLMGKCREFIERIAENSRYADFINNVNLEQFKNYIDVVRIPMCISKVQRRLMTSVEKSEEELSQGENEGDTPFYKSFDAFFYDVERISMNCMMYNSKDSDLYNSAQILLEELRAFRMTLNLSPVNSVELLETIFKQHDTKNYDLEVDWNSVRTFYDLDLEMQEMKKKYSRYSQNGKIIAEKLFKIKKLIGGYFLVINNKICRAHD
ncbi:taf2 [Nucleospora cyclopteri]